MGAVIPRIEDTELVVEFGRQPSSVAQIVGLARGKLRARLWDDSEYRALLERSLAVVRTKLDAGDTVYGVTTGFGESCQQRVERERAHDLARNLVRFHGCGTGADLDPETSLAVVACRIASLAGGHSGVRPVVLQRLVELLGHRLAPRIPEEGSVGASGDLTPLSYVAAVLQGDRQVWGDGGWVEAGPALRAAGMTPLQLEPKESLAIMNGTSAMTGIACLALDRTERLIRWSAALTALAVEVTQGNPAHFDDRIFRKKPHPGQRRCAQWIAEALQLEGPPHHIPARVQDRYSLRCAPHVLGVALDAMPHWIQVVETELNGANDNPLVDVDDAAILHGGNFYGGHIAYVMDSLKTQVANVADLLDRQLSLICHPETSHGLPANLVHPTAGPAHHGFKAMQITASALTAEALKACMPASVFSRSTECHNQDKVSMGTIAARDAVRVLDLTENVAAIHQLALAQAVDLRGNDRLSPRLSQLVGHIREHVAPNTADRPMEEDIRTVVRLHRDERLPLP
ncbi:MAG TPA: aromatic amino acid ammonia-lyase [Myxococcales bacterium LLY-WYZ-16_1]|nr:aromatic amino acid ammonia-lyase [Myxococcales bacterium LLY-WYZ-16_1]